MDATYLVPSGINRLQQRALIVGGIALVLCIVGAFLSPAARGHFFRAYLVAFIFWTGVAIGSLAILMLQHMSGGAWGIVLRRLLESSTRTIPLMAVLFLPLLLGLHSLYHWTDANAVAHDAALQHKAPYLNIPFFIGRAVFYFAAWFAMAYFLNKWSLEQDRSSDPRNIKRQLQNLSGPGLVLFGLTVTFAAVDWVMSLEPHWASTIFGLIIMVGWGLSAFAFMILVAVALANQEPMAGVYRPSHFHDFGKLLLAFVMVWAYFSFSQLLIIWSGNLPEEIPWYLRRFHGGWRYVGLALVLFHFALPFVLLLSRDLKRNARRLAMVAALVMVMRIVDLIWLIGPTAAESHAGGGAIFAWMYLLAPIGLGGIWLWFFAMQLKQRPLLPLGEPQLEGVLHPAGNHH